MKTRELIQEGKTKKIWRFPLSTYEVLIESKDDITAGDGVKREKFAGKGIYSTATTVNCFELLQAHHIPNHFIKREDERTFRALELRMIPIEVVIRRLATGSFLARNPNVPEGTIFSNPIIEFFEKNDTLHDPILIHDLVTCRVLRFNAKQPLAEGFMGEGPLANREEWWHIINKLVYLGERTFLVLERAWATFNVTLVDLKIECGQSTVTGDIIVGDVITNDEWRIWPSGKKSKQLDKQNFRELNQATKEAMDAIKANYELVMEMTGKFSFLNLGL